MLVMQDLGIRSMVEADVPLVACLEQQTLSPWSLKSLQGELQQDRGVVLVAELHGDGSTAPEIVGWCACRYIIPEAELLKIAVDKHFRRAKVATLLLKHLSSFLTQKHIETLFLEVRAKNRNALKFYIKSGFVCIGERLGYYSNPDDNASLFRKML